MQAQQDTFDYLDSLVDEAHTRRSQIDDELTAYKEKHKASRLTPEDAHHVNRLMHERGEIDTGIQHLTNSPHYFGYLDHYNQKYMTPQQPKEEAKPEESSLLENIWKGTKDTAKYAIQNPKSALAHTYLGAKEFASLPFRGIEGLFDRDIPGIHARQNIKEHQEGLAKADKEAGIDPRGTGPVVMENIGQMAVPIPMTISPAAKFLSRETAKNVAKGAGLGAATHITERVANDEPVLDEGLGTSAGVGGTIAALLGRYAGRGMAKPGEPAMVSPPSGTPKPPGPAPSTPPPTTKPAGVKEVLSGKPIPPAAEAQAPTAAPKIPPTAPATAQTLLKREAPAPSSPMAAAIKGIEEEKAARIAAGRTPDNQPIAAATKEAPIPVNKILEETQKFDAELKKAADEALLGKVIKGELNVKDIPSKKGKAANGPKSEAPAPAVEGGAGVVDLNARKGVFEPNRVVPGMPRAPKDLTDDQALAFFKGINQDGLSPEQAYKMVLQGRLTSELNKPKISAPQLKEPKPGDVLPFEREGKIATTKPLKQTPEQKVVALFEQLKAEGKSPEKAKELAEFRTNTRLPAANVPVPKEMKFEEYLNANGYKVEKKEPFPGQVAYRVKNAKGDLVASGDEPTVIAALNQTVAPKGIKLTSGVDPTDVKEAFSKLSQRLGLQVPEGVTIENNPHKDKVLNSIMREAGLETTDFNVRKNPAAVKVTNATRNYEDAAKARVNDLLYTPDNQRTKLFDYFASAEKDQEPVHKALVAADRLDADFDTKALAAAGLNSDQIRAFEGVREAIKTVEGWVREIPGHEDWVPRFKNYLPHSFFGDVEIFMNGKKYVPTDANGNELGSTFQTLRQAAAKAWELKQKNPTATFNIKFHQDPNYIPSRGFADHAAVSAVQAKIKEKGTFTAAELEEIFKTSRTMKGFMKHLEERSGESGYETQNLQKVLGTYFMQAAQAVERNIAKTEIDKILAKHGDEMSPGMIRSLNEHVDRVFGKPAWDQMVAQHLIKDTWLGKHIDPIKAGAGIQTAKDYITYSKLGFGNAAWALVNMDSLTRHVWPMLQAEASPEMGRMASERFLGPAIKEFFTNHALKQKLAHHGAIDIQMMSESRPDIMNPHMFKGTLTPAKVIMAMGTWTEEFVRGVAAISRYRMAQAQGMGEKEAIQAASKFVAETVGRYSKQGKPPAFTGGIGSTMGMFKTYPVVMLQNMVKAFEAKDKGVPLRYMLAALGASGMVGMIPGSEEVDKLATRTLGFSPLQWAYQHVKPGILTGAASILPEPYSVDFSRKAGLPDVFPSDMSDFLGPVFNTYGQTIVDLVNGQPGNAALDLIPTSIKQFYQAYAKPGYVVGRSDKPIVEIPNTPGQRLKRGLGFQGNQEVWASRAYQATQGIEEYQTSEKHSLAAKIIDGKATPKDMQKFSELGGTNRLLKEEQIRRQSTALERQARSNPRALRQLFQYEE